MVIGHMSFVIWKTESPLLRQDQRPFVDFPIAPRARCRPAQQILRESGIAAGQFIENAVECGLGTVAAVFAATVLPLSRPKIVMSSDFGLWNSLKLV